jgi:hypothetical protein
MAASTPAAKIPVINLMVAILPQLDRTTQTRGGSFLNYVCKIHRISGRPARPGLPLRQRSLDILAWHWILRGTCQNGEIPGNAHLFDEGPASPTHRQMKLDVEARPEAELAIDQTAGAIGDFTATKHGLSSPQSW